MTYDRTVGRMRMLRDGVTLETTNFDPMLGWTPNWHVEWQAEVHDYGDDMVGTAASPARFTNLKWQLTVGGPWATPTGLWGQSNNSHYAFEWETADKFRVWTR